MKNKFSLNNSMSFGLVSFLTLSGFGGATHKSAQRDGSAAITSKLEIITTGEHSRCKWACYRARDLAVFLVFAIYPIEDC